MYGFGTEKFRELIYHRYGSPRDYINSAIKHRSLDKATNTIIQSDDDDKSWSLYLACMSNAFCESMSYEEFLEKTKRTEIQKDEKPSDISKKQTEMLVKKANTILTNFKPKKEAVI